MTTLLNDPRLIAEVIGFIAALTALIKVHTDVVRIKNDRKNTAEIRDFDSANMHDQLIKHEFAITSLKDAIALHNTVMTDMQTAMNELNVNCAKLSVVVDTLTDAVKELRHAET